MQHPKSKIMNTYIMFIKNIYIMFIKNYDSLNQKI